MLWLWILGGIVLLFVLFCMLRLGVQINFDMPVYAWVTVGPIRFQVAPSRPKKPSKKSGKNAKKEKTKKEKPDVLERLTKIPKPSLEDLKSAYRTLWPPMKKALRRFGRGIKIDPLTLSVILAGKDDPAAAAEWYGYANAIVWTVMPVLEQLVRIPNPGIHLGVDFDEQKLSIHGSAGVSLRIGTLLAMAIRTAIPALKWILDYQKTHEKKPEQPEKKIPVQPAA